tara:strand:+ start:75 stop:620 length:546 start_codon:yes stop_codon:yes gene_type:complete
MFNNEFTLTGKSPNPVSIISKASNLSDGENILAGVYDHGLITICDNSRFDFSTLKDWSAHIGEEALPLAYTAWGEVFCISYSHKKLYWLFPIENGASDLGSSAFSILDNIKTDQKLASSLLDIERYKELSSMLPSLNYGECYILKPLQILGGNEQDPSAYQTIGLENYLSLVHQTHDQIHS